MSENGPIMLELSPPFKDRLLSAFRAIIAFILAIIVIVGAVIVDIPTIIQFIAIFTGALLFFFSLWKILRRFTVKLVVDQEEIRFRDRFIWRTVSWSEIISVGRANDIKTTDHKGVLKKIKALILLTDSGIKSFEMSSYSLDSGLETVNKVSNYGSETKSDDVEEESSED